MAMHLNNVSKWVKYKCKGERISFDFIVYLYWIVRYWNTHVSLCQLKYLYLHIFPLLTLSLSIELGLEMNFLDLHIQKWTDLHARTHIYTKKWVSGRFCHTACTDDSRGLAWPGGGETKGHGDERRASHPDYPKPPSLTSCEVQQVH